MVRLLLALIALGLVASPAGARSEARPSVDRDTLVVALDKEVRNLDAQVTSTGDSMMFAWQIYDTLYGFDADGNLVPRMASGVTIAEDGLRYTFKLRDGLRFHDGTPLTAADVKYSIERIIEPATKSTRRIYFAPVVAAVQVPDPRTIVIDLKQPDGAFLNKVAGFLFIVPQKYTSSLSSPESFAAAPIGSGPYRVKEHRVGQVLVLERFDEFWGEKPGIKTLMLKMITEPASRVNAVISGEVDVAMVVPSADVARLKQSPDLDVIVNPNGGPLHVRLYSNDPSLPAANREVRQALQYAIDSEAISKGVFHGIGSPMATYISRFYPYGSDPELKPYPYDPKRARELLTKAGYPRGFETRLYAGTDQPKEVAEAVAGYWSQLGIKTEIVRLDYAAWSRLNNTHKTSPMTIQQFSNAIYDPIHPVAGSFAKDGAWSDYANPAVDALIAELDKTSSPEERGVLFRKIGRILHEDAATVLITELYNVYVKKKGVNWQVQRGSSLYNFRRVTWH